TQQLADGKWRSQLRASQEGTVDFPPLFAVRGDGEQIAYVRGVRPDAGETGDWRAAILTDFEPSEALVDPSHEGFDSDRFDNSSDWPGIWFFPGSANTLHDDAYTVVWLPYAFRRPGEPFSFGMQGGLFRYLQSGLFFKAEYAPSEKTVAYQIRQR